MSLLDRFPHKCRIQRRVKTSDVLGGSSYSRVVERRNVLCWQQTLSTNDVRMFEKSTNKISTKLYFLTDPEVTERHEIVITEINGEAVATADERIISGLMPAGPDASAGKGVLFRVYGNDIPGADT